MWSPGRLVVFPGWVHSVFQPSRAMHSAWWYSSCCAELCCVPSEGGGVAADQRQWHADGCHQRRPYGPRTAVAVVARVAAAIRRLPAKLHSSGAEVVNQRGRRELEMPSVPFRFGPYSSGSKQDRCTRR